MSVSAARVAFLTNFIAPYRTPVLRLLARELGGLRILLSTPMESNREWAPEWDGLDVVVQRGLTVPRLWRHPSGFREWVPLHVPLDTRSRLDAYEPDLVLSGELGTRTLQSAGWCQRRGRPLAIWATLSERTEQGRGRIRGLVRQRVLSRADAVIVNGESGARYIRGFGFPDERIHRVNQASPVSSSGARPDRAVAGEDGGGDDLLEIVYVGRLVELKGLEPMIRDLRAWCDARSRRVRLRVVGGGPLEQRVRRLPTGPHLEVVVEGSVPFAELEAHYRGADLAILPTLADEWGLVVNEAMACGLPVLGSIHSQAVTELVEEGRTGWRYDPEEPGRLAAALDQVVDVGLPGLRRMGRAAHERVAGLTPETMAGQLLEVIHDAIAVRRRRS